MARWSIKNCATTNVRCSPAYGFDLMGKRCFHKLILLKF